MKYSQSIAAFGDIHLERLKRWFRRDWSNYQFGAIENNLKIVKRKGIKQIIQLGDLFHSGNPHERTVLRLVDLIKKYNIPWTIIPGNHDRPLLDNHSMDILLWLTKEQAAPITVAMEPDLLNIGAFKVWLSPHPYVELPPQGTIFDFAVGHYPRTGAKRDNGSIEKGGYSPKGFWVLGDYHQHQINKNFVYAGTLAQTEFHESIKKGFLVVSKIKHNTRSSINTSLIPVKAPYRLHTVVCNDVDDLNELKESPDFYSLKVSREFEFPVNWQELHPNIVQHSILEDKQSDHNLETALQLSDDPFEGIGDYVKAKHELSDKMTRWGLSKLTELNHTSED